MPAGRPTKYSKELGTKICDLIAKGKSIRRIGEMEGMPSVRAMNKWLDQKDHEFIPQYVRAREAQADYWVEQCLSISDNTTNDLETVYEDEDGVPIERTNHEAINRARLRVDTRKWIAARMAPKKYGDRVMQEHSGPDGGPMQHQIAVDAPPQETREQWEQRKLLEADKVKIELVDTKLVSR